MKTITISECHGWWVAGSDDSYSGEGSDPERALRNLMETRDVAEQQQVKAKLIDRLRETYDSAHDDEEEI